MCEARGPSSCRWLFKNLHLGDYLPSPVVSMWRVGIWKLQMAVGQLQNHAARAQKTWIPETLWRSGGLPSRTAASFIFLGWLAFSTPCGYVVYQGYIFNLRWLFPYYLHDEAAAPKAASQKTSSLRSSAEVIENAHPFFWGFFFCLCTYVASAWNKSVWTCITDEAWFCALWNQMWKKQTHIKQKTLDFVNLQQLWAYWPTVST